MKKFIVLLSVLVVAFSLTACNKTDSEKQKDKKMSMPEVNEKNCTTKAILSMPANDMRRKFATLCVSS